ncbi:MAG: flagellar motor protein MotB [Limisphaerales bacterium]
MAAGGGGSWKVAYADFATAMMAFFMVHVARRSRPKNQRGCGRILQKPRL